MTGSVHVYEDFVAWREAAPGRRQTVGDAMRHFTATPLDTILDWGRQYQNELRRAGVPEVSIDMTGPVREVVFTGSVLKPKSAGYLLRWAASERGGANLETSRGLLAGFLVADGKDGGGRQLFAAYRPPEERGQAPEGVIRQATAEQGLAAILGPPAAPYTSYGTRVPAVRFVKQYTTSSGNMFRQYEGPGGRRVDVRMREGRTGQVRYTQREATAEARRLLGLVPQAAEAAEPEMG
jgi:hypothetical protein